MRALHAAGASLRQPTPGFLRAAGARPPQRSAAQDGCSEGGLSSPDISALLRKNGMWIQDDATFYLSRFLDW